MKFRCILRDSSSIQRFTNAIQIISKFSKQCVIRISVTGFFFISFEETGVRQPIVWIHVSRESYFDEFNLCGVSEEHNEICLRFAPNALLKVLCAYKPSHQYSKYLKISLTNRKMPCLTCEIFRSEPEVTRISLHDVPVEVISRKDWDDINPPEIVHKPDLVVTLPDVDNLESVWDKLKSLSRHLVVLANGDGSLSLKMESELTVVALHYKDLTVAVSEHWENSESFVKARVQSNKFMLLKDLYHSNPVRVLLKIRNRKYVMIETIYEDFKVHYIIAAIKK